MTDHPLTETAAAELWDKHRGPNVVPFGEQGRLYMRDQTAMLRAAFDAGREYERTNPEDDRPWEPLGGRPVRVGDEVRRERAGITTTAVVGGVDKCGNPRTAGGSYIGNRLIGTWHVRRPVPELPPEEDGVVLIPADGCEYITATVGGQTYRAREAMRADGRWCAIWRTPDGQRVCYSVRRENINPDTWKVDDQ